MVSKISILFMILNVLIILAGPFILLKLGSPLKWSSFALGVVTFIITQIVLRSSVIKFLSGISWFEPIKSNLVAYAFFLGGTAGIFEEVGRFVIILLLLRNWIGWENGISFGLGHWFAEAFILVGLTMISNIVTSILINSGTIDVSINQQIERARELLTTTPYYHYLIAGMERILVLNIQVLFSLIVMYSVASNKISFLLLAVILHVIVDTPGLLLIRYTNIFLAEGYIFILSMISFYFIFKMKKLLMF